LQIDDTQAMLDGKPQYIVFNGRTGALTENVHGMVGEKIRMYVGNGGVNLVSSFHLIGEVFDHVWQDASLTTPPLEHVQTTLVPAGGATVLDFDLNVAGNYVFVDHALARMDRGAWGVIKVSGDSQPGYFQGTTTSGGGH
jgi:nitrite reductase (NO-forming)